MFEGIEEVQACYSLSAGWQSACSKIASKWHCITNPVAGAHQVVCTDS